MKNLKRALSFAVAAIMLVGMMAIGTSAFTDDAAIENDVAVNVMYNLGIISGKPDGSFDPTATVTRGEMAKMICVALNGGKTPVLDATVSTYPDTVGHWAAGYIEYCSSLGIVAGSTDGNFYPNNPITGTEAAKMVSIALGYVAENEGFVNNKDWSTNINVVANKKGLYEDVTSLPGAPISRDNAAQMLYNGLSAVMVEYEYQLTTNNGDLVSVAVAKDKGNVGGKACTILNTKFGLEIDTTVLTDVAYDADKDEYTYTFAANPGDAKLTKGTVDYSELYMQNVTILWKDGTTADKLYGIFGNGAVLATGTGADVDATDYATANKIVVGEAEIEAEAADLPVYKFLADATSANVVSDYAAGALAAYTMKFVDEDGDDIADFAVVYPFEVGKVTYVGTEDVVINGCGTYSLEDDVIYAGVAKNDWAVVTSSVYTLETKDVVAKAPAAVKLTVAAFDKYGAPKMTDGNWYTNVSGTTLALGEEYEAVAINGYIYNAVAVEEETDTSKVVYVMAADTTLGFDSTTQKVKVMFTDGTTAIVDVAKVGGEKVADSVAYQFTNDGNGLYTFTVDASGNYELTAIYSGDFDATYTVASDVIDEARFGAYRFNDDAIFFVTDKDGEVAVVKGSEINKWDNVTAYGVSLFMETKNGFNYAQLGMLTVDTDPANEATTGYGMMTSSAIKIKDGTKYYAEFSIWNGTEVVTVVEELSGASASISSYKKGQMITFNMLEGNEIDCTPATVVETAITAWDGTYVVLNGYGEYEVDEDVEIYYVDSKNVKGMAGGEIAIANKTAAGAYVNNVSVLCNGSGEIVALFVDVNNEWSNKTFGAGAVKVDGVYYDTLTEAVAAAKSAGSTITLMADVGGSGILLTVNGGKNVTLDLNGYGIVRTGYPTENHQSQSKPAIYVNGATLNVKDSAGGGAVIGDDAVWVAADSALNISGGNFSTNGNDGCPCIYIRGTNAEVNISGGNFSSSWSDDFTPAAYNVLNIHGSAVGSSQINVTGGSFENFDPRVNSADGYPTSYVPAGYHSVQNGTNWIVVKG